MTEREGDRFVILKEEQKRKIDVPSYCFYTAL